MEKIDRDRGLPLTRNPLDAPSVDDLLPANEKVALETLSSPRLSRLASAREEASAVKGPSLQASTIVNFRDVAKSRMIVKPEARLVAIDANDAATAEFALLSARLNKFKTQDHLKRVLVVACKAGSGGSLVCANLALALAQNPAHKVLLLDGDLEQPSLASRFGLQAPKGLWEYLVGTEPVENVVRYLSPGGIWFMSAGSPPKDPEERLQVLHSPWLPILLRREADWFDWVIVDSPPLEGRVATGAYTPFCDGLLVVVRKGHTTQKLLRRTLEMLDGQPVLGYALNE